MLAIVTRRNSLRIVSACENNHRVSMESDHNNQGIRPQSDQGIRPQSDQGIRPQSDQGIRPCEHGIRPQWPGKVDISRQSCTSTHTELEKNIPTSAPWTVTLTYIIYTVLYGDHLSTWIHTTLHYRPICATPHCITHYACTYIYTTIVHTCTSSSRLSTSTYTQKNDDQCNEIPLLTAFHFILYHDWDNCGLLQSALNHIHRFFSPHQSSGRGLFFSINA